MASSATLAFASTFAQALRDPDATLPESLVCHTGRAPTRRFAVYRNNVAVGLIGALETRFPAIGRIVGEEFFRAMARAYVALHPPRSPVIMLYGDDFADFIAAFPPAADIPYLADVARIEAARTRAYHAADCAAIAPATWASLAADDLEHLHMTFHPSVEVVRSPHPAVTIWAMNTGAAALAPIAEWTGEEALIARPVLDVTVRRLPAGAASFLLALKEGQPLAVATARALTEHANFDLAASLALLIADSIVTTLAHTKDISP